MKLIQVTKGATIMVDDGDFERVSKFKWSFGDGHICRSKRVNGRQTTIKLARFILGAPAGVKVDHKSTDTLDNRRSNLRIATHQQNQCNRGKNKNNTSGFKGIHWHKNCAKWRAVIMANGKLHHLGLFENKLDAAAAYKKAAVELHGEFART